MHILYLSQLVPYPPDAGAKMRIYYTLCYLALQHKVTLLAFSRPDDRPEGLEHLRSFCREVYTVPMRRSRVRDGMHWLTSLVMGRSFIIQRDYVPEMAEKVDELLSSGQFEAVHADQIYMVQYGIRGRELSNVYQPRLVVDKHNADFLIFQRMAAGEKNLLKRALLEREWRMLRRFEAESMAQFDHVVTVTDEDRQILHDLIVERQSSFGTDGSQTRLHTPHFTTIPICVDTEEIQPVTPKPEVQDVLYLGGLHWPPNSQGVSWFGQEAWPQVKEQIPEATFTIVGKNPAKAVQDLGESDRSIQVTGYVADPTPYLEGAGVFIVPLFAGSGMRVKIVDAWRWGLPVVSTTIGAEGIEYRDGENILIADTAEDFAQAVIRALSEPALNQALRQNGRRWVEEHYDWRRVYPAWDEIYGR